MTPEEEIVLLTKTKEELLRNSNCVVQYNTHLHKDVYAITVPVDVWHRIFKTEEAKELGFYGG